MNCYLGVFGRGRARERKEERLRGDSVIFKSKNSARWRKRGALEELMTNTGRVICKQLEWEQRVKGSRDLTRMLSGGFFLESACKDVRLDGK